MKYHSQLLKKYLSLDDRRENIAQNLILKTAEIEEIIERKLPDSIVIGKILKVWKHPEADKLNVCEVDCGNKGTFQIVCGGSNVAPELLVPVALVGTHFPQADLKIEKRAVRGVDSEGMICSKGELQINEDLDTHEIWDLAKDVEVSPEDVGLALKEKFPWLEATVMDVDNKNMTNRPDLTGHFGIAIELNAIYPETQKKYNKIKEYLASFSHTDIANILAHSEHKLSRQVLGKSENLNTYIALELDQIEIKKSDFFSRLQLLDLGSHSINNWVDFSNLFMNISGHPVHFFDADKLEGDLIIRDAKEGELFVDLFEKEHILTAQDLVIADEKKILALAGIIGGRDSGISETTSKIIVEIANFDPVTIRKTGMRLGLRTDAELRFEKNINPIYSLYVLLLFLDELKFYQKGLGNFTVSGLGYFINAHLDIHKKPRIPFDFQASKHFIFGDQEVDFVPKAQKILQDLGFELDSGSVLVPFWRSPEDITIAEDLIEEIARIWGYDAIESTAILSEIKDQKMGIDVQITRRLEEILVNVLHFDQSETYPWVSDRQLALFGKTADQALSLKNPLNPETPYLRDAMIYNLLEHAAKNSKFFDSCKIFDIGRVWKHVDVASSEEILDSRYAKYHIHEVGQLGMLWYQKANADRTQDAFLQMKGAIDSLLNKLHIKGKLSYQKTDFDHYHPQKQVSFILRVGADLLEIAHLATLHPLLTKQYKFPGTAQVVYANLNLEILKNLLDTQPLHQDFETLQDQILWRDLSFLIDENADFSDLILALEKVKSVQEIKVFDLYQGDQLPEGKKSIAVQIKIKGDGAMTTEQINEVMQSSIKKAESVGATLRAI